MKRQKRKPSALETILGIVILTILCGIAAGIFRQQFELSPAISALQAKIPLEGAHLQLSSSDVLPLAGPFDDIKPLSPVETFNADTLYQKINGKADLYLSAGFKELRCQRFRAVNAADEWLEMFRYDMGSDRNAFAVYSSQRRENSIPADFAKFSYRTENATFFVHGPFYVEIIAASASQSSNRLALTLAQDFIRRLPLNAAAVPELALFPKTHLDASSITLIPSDAFGYERLNQIYTAVYELSGSRLTAFISRRKTPANARELAEAYYQFLITFGGQGQASDRENTRVVSIFDSFELIFFSGPYLAGVHEAADQKKAEQLADMLSANLKAVSDERTK